jgi:mono/diheme cytochrome c family protein
VTERNASWTAAGFAAVAAISIALAASPLAAAQNADADPAKIEQGKHTYAENCSHCHGFNMVNAGTVIPDLRRFAGDKALFFTTVKNGRNNRMPPWGDILSDDQIEGLWAYISSQRKP